MDREAVYAASGHTQARAGTVNRLTGLGVKPEVGVLIRGGYMEGFVMISSFAVSWRYFGAWFNVRNHVLWVKLYTSDQSKTIRIAVPAVIGRSTSSP
jgi:hypothetical protein